MDEIILSAIHATDTNAKNAATPTSIAPQQMIDPNVFKNFFINTTSFIKSGN